MKTPSKFALLVATSIALLSSAFVFPAVAAEDTESVAYATDTQPDFSPGSSLLLGLLATTHFDDLFDASVVNGADAGADTLDTYLFRISKDGILCPFRVMNEKKGIPEFYSNDYENAGCLDVRDFLKSTRVTTTFASEKNLNPPAYLNGKKEEAGLRFSMVGDSLAQTLNSSGQIQSIVLNLKISGKAHIHQLLWAQGNSTFKIKLSKSSRGYWTASTLAKNSETDWAPFQHLDSHIEHQSLAAAGVTIALNFITRKIDVNHPKQLNAIENDFK
jgi:hypothetical protein